MGIKRIKRVELDGLFRREEQKAFDLALDERVTIIFGINGSGKTTVLRMLDALYHRQHELLAPIPFDDLRITLDSGEVVAVKPDRDSVQQWPGSAAVRNQVLLYRLVGAGGQILQEERITLPDLKQDAEEVDLRLRRVDERWVMNRSDSPFWKHSETGEELTLPEAVQRFHLLSVLSRGGALESLAWLDEFLPRGMSRYLGAERLSAGALPGPRQQRPRALAAAVEEWSARIRDYVKETKEAYYRRAEELIARFPQEMMSLVGDVARQARPAPNPDVLRELLVGLAGKRRRYERAGMLDAGQTAESLGDFSAGWVEWQVLATLDAYVNLVGEHLEVLDDLDRRMQGLANSLTGKFGYGKKVEVTGAGIRVWTREGLDLPLSLLSSGEQHELIQDCEFYFGIQPGTLLLIDEPETSLHILWQQKYVSDLMRLVAGTESDALLATHSPDIIEDHRHLMRSFDPPEEANA